MVYPDNVIYIFKESRDPFYFIRFLNHCITKSFRGDYYIEVNGYKCKILISGVLEEIGDENKKYNSLTEFYNSATGLSLSMYDETIFHYIYFKPEYTLHRLLSTLKDDDVLEFNDEKYRVFSMVRDLRERVRHYTGMTMNLSNANTNANAKSVLETLKWNNTKYTISLSKIREHGIRRKTDNCIKLLEAYESGEIQNLYYNKPGTREFYKIC